MAFKLSEGFIDQRIRFGVRRRPDLVIVFDNRKK